MIYDYEVTTGKGETLKLSEFKGKVVLIVNTATGCGFTPQYALIEQLYKDYHEKGLEILDIPCNQFGHQAPGSDEEIHNFCTTRYQTTFPQMKKSDVNGAFVIDRNGNVVARFEPTADMAKVEECIKAIL